MIILIVDDTDDNSKKLKDMLTVEGFDVMTAGNGIAALKVIRNNKIDFIISDLNMPEMDGFQLAEKVRIVDKTTPFVLYSKMDAPADLITISERLGINKFIGVPDMKGIKDAVMDRLNAALNENNRISSQGL